VDECKPLMYGQVEGQVDYEAYEGGYDDGEGYEYEYQAGPPPPDCLLIVYQ